MSSAFAGKPAACSLIPILFYLASSGACFSCSDTALCQSTYGADADGLLLLCFFFFFIARLHSLVWTLRGLKLHREHATWDRKQKPTWGTCVSKYMFSDPTSVSDNGDLRAAHLFKRILFTIQIKCWQGDLEFTQAAHLNDYRYSIGVDVLFLKFATSFVSMNIFNFKLKFSWIHRQ